MGARRTGRNVLEYEIMGAGCAVLGQLKFAGRLYAVVRGAHEEDVQVFDVVRPRGRGLGRGRRVGSLCRWSLVEAQVDYHLAFLAFAAARIASGIFRIAGKHPQRQCEHAKGCFEYVFHNMRFDK